MDYRFMLEEAIKFKNDFKLPYVSINLGEITSEQELDLVYQLKLEPEINYGAAYVLYYFPKWENNGFDVAIHYKVKEVEAVA